MRPFSMDRNLKTFSMMRLEEKKATDMLANLKEYAQILNDVQGEIESIKSLNNVYNTENIKLSANNKLLDEQIESEIKSHKKFRELNLELQKEISKNKSSVKHVSIKSIDICNELLEGIRGLDEEHECKSHQVNEIEVNNKQLSVRQKNIEKKEMVLLKKEEVLMEKESDLENKEQSITPDIEKIEVKTKELKDLEYDLHIKERKITKRLNQLNKQT